jgi:RHS repeat-associated protein
VTILLAVGCVASQAQPHITGFLVNGVASNTGPVGATLTIQGSGFGSIQGLSGATLNGFTVAGNGVSAIWSDTSIVVLIPNTASSGPVVVNVRGHGSSNAVNFYIGALITGVSPPTALVANSVTITGNGFGTSGGTVTFNGIAATTSGWTDASITAQVPNGATAGPIVVTVNGQLSNGMAFTPTPQILALTPNNGLSGATVTIAGNSFGPASGPSPTVTFNGVAAAVSAWNNTSITVAAPSGALTGNVVVTVNGAASAGQVFTYTPQVTGISPSPALADTPVTVQGINFGGQQNNSTVTFNGVAAVVSSWTNVSITATVPETATAGPVVVTVNGVSSNGVGFSFPALYSFSLGYAPNGDVLTANDSVNGNWTYSYDDYNRLSTAVATNGNGCQESYDEFGNRWSQQPYGSGNSCFASSLTFTGNSGNSNNNNNRMDGYTYDAAGNLLNDGCHAYTYDAENRIVNVTAVGPCVGTGTYTYNADGQRIQKVASAGTATYLYDLGGQVVTEVNSSGVWTRGEVYAGGKHLATYGNGSQGTAYLVQVDWLGTERTRLLPNGDLFETCTSLPFGDGQICNGSADPSPKHLTGKERDNESGLDYFGARYYSSALGRLVTPDWAAHPVAVPYATLADPQSLNLYSYIENNPINRIDPLGHDWFWINQMWQWQEGHKFVDPKTHEVLSTQGYRYLLVFQKTGVNEFGAATGTLTLYDQNEKKMSAPAFSGGSDDTHGGLPIGGYMIKLDIRGTLDAKGIVWSGPDKDDYETKPFPGVQFIPKWIKSPSGSGYSLNFRVEWGTRRAALNPMPGETDEAYQRNYLHGKERKNDYTHNCICERSEHMMDKILSLPATRVPVQVQ